MSKHRNNDIFLMEKNEGEIYRQTTYSMTKVWERLWFLIQTKQNRDSHR